ncbi:FAD-dependent oxidoreductase [Aliidongia dinghuensis]|uniref:FAD-dependent oxidoreductase n=1 Tax=Aliidongia dinghuensis TaxID=1867774 RepID=A0A8J3E3F3_9PROT|nr:FAD-binding oxidoreductase [Aliidongia dinghuensis]GGF18137.1 FAD-dependent oxidoreductase [Aliidongia dinghuensis]
MTEPFPLSPSLWAATAPPAAATPPLGEATRADVCIVGGGYCGLSAALHLAEQGADTVLLEAREPGWGGSGRNGGQVIPGLKYDPLELEAKFGPEAGPQLVAFAGSTADTVFDLIGRHAMDVPHVRNGWIQGAHTEAGLGEVARRAEQWAARGVATELLDRDGVARKLGSHSYLGGWIDKRGGAIQPLAFARGLARAALAAGARIHGGTAVTRLERQGDRWRVETDRGVAVDAAQVLMATNAYTGDVVPRLRRTVIAVNSFQVATEPLGDNVRKTILPEGHVSSDTRKLLLYFRLDHQGRLLMGGRGPFREPRGADDWAHLERVLGKLFPQAKGTPIAYRWCGRVAVTRDYLPHLHEPAPGLLVDIGCMGRGVGLQTTMGRALARYLGSGNQAELPLPVVPITPIPAHALNRLYVSAIVAWYRLTDGGVK